MPFADARQEYYSIGIGTQNQSIRLADRYSTWSAIAAVQHLSQHTKDPKELKDYLSVGQKAHFYYQPRRRKDKEDIYIVKALGTMVEIKKKMTALIRAIKLNEIKGMHPQRDQQQQDNTDELCRLAKIMPDHIVLGMTEGEHKRLQAALNRASSFNLSQAQSLDSICDRALASTVKVIRKAETNGIDSWIQEILDPKRATQKRTHGQEVRRRPPHYPQKCGGRANILDTRTI